MEHLPETKGKGVLMFAKRRQRMDELSAEQEEMKQKVIPVDAYVETELEISKPTPQEESTQVPIDVYDGQKQQYQEQQYQQHMLPQSANDVNDLDLYQGTTVSRPLVPNRTAKPFLGGYNQGPEHFMPVRGVSSPTTKKPENIFKVPVPVNTTPQVWSPTADIIASRDERIAIPAIKTGILPETKRRGVSKVDLKETSMSQKKGDQRSVIESCPEDDFLSLGAEACNFMQAPTIKLKNPPPVLPKPVINPAQLPWSAESHGSRSPLPSTNSVPTIVRTQVQRAPQGNLSQPEPTGKLWTSLPSQPISQQAWAPNQTPALYQSARTPPVSIHAGPSYSKTSWTQSQNNANSVASCPPQNKSPYFNIPKTASMFPKGCSSDAGASEGLNLKGKGAELFARRQSRMEKFVVDDETVRANKARSSSPTLSMPSTWKYSSNIRAPPPVSYNPVLSPFYPLAAGKQPPAAISPKIKPKANKEKAKPPPKHLNVLDVMKHQPYQLDSSLFTYNSTPDCIETRPKLCSFSPKELKQMPTQVPTILQAQSPTFEPSTMLSPSPNSFPKFAQPVKQNPPKASGQGFNRSRSLSLPQRQSSLSPSSPVSSPGVYPTREPLSRQYSWVEQPKKPLSSWKEVDQSPVGLDKAKLSAAHRKSLPETPAEWKQRVPHESLGVPQAVASTNGTFSLVRKKPILCGPPFRPAQPLGSSNRYNRGNSLPRNFTLKTNYRVKESAGNCKVSWKL